MVFQCIKAFLESVLTACVGEHNLITSPVLEGYQVNQCGRAGPKKKKQCAKSWSIAGITLFFEGTGGAEPLRWDHTSMAPVKNILDVPFFSKQINQRCMRNDACTTTVFILSLLSIYM